ncbi:MAG: alpha-amylase family glycosyl hydrolase [Saprospiraceae bacterium]
MREHPMLFEINTRPWLAQFGQGATLKDVPESYWDDLGEKGIELVWLMGVWQTADVTDATRRDHPERVLDYQPDRNYPPFDYRILASPYAIDQYEPNPALGTRADLEAVRSSLHAREMRLILDFVPNHFSVESRWIERFPEYFIRGTFNHLVNQPTEYFEANGSIFAHGRDPYFAGWQDTVQVNYFNPEARAWMAGQLENVAEMCDGVRCDMAMLPVQRIFRNTWQHHHQGEDDQSMEEFWPAAIEKVKKGQPDFQLMAEVYWDMEWELQMQGFDYTYDKRLLDRLVNDERQGIREHLLADIEYQNKLVRFLENHDEERALTHFGKVRSYAAAVAAYTLPGMRFFYEGQWEGRMRKIPVQMVEYPPEIYCTCSGSDQTNLPSTVFCPETWQFYLRLMELLSSGAMQGRWSLLQVTGPQQDQFFAWKWENDQGRTLVVINYAASTGTAYLSLPECQGMKPTGLFCKSSRVTHLWIEDHLLIPLRPYQFQIFSI